MAPTSYRIALLLGLLWGAANVAAAPAPAPAPQDAPTTTAPPAGSANACGQIHAATEAFKTETPASTWHHPPAGGVGGEGETGRIC